MKKSEGQNWKKKRVSLSGMKKFIIIERERERERERLSLLPSGLLWHPNKRNLFSFFSRLKPSQH